MKTSILLFTILLTGCMSRVDVNDLALAAQKCGGYDQIHELAGFGVTITPTCKVHFNDKINSCNP